MKISPVTQKPYINDAIVGNSSMLVALGKNGEIYRLWWPHIDMPQHIEAMKTGIYIEGFTSETVWLHEDQKWSYEQHYIPKTNILKTKATALHLPIEITSTDFIVPDQDIFIRYYQLTNTSKQAISIRFFVYASFTITENRFYNTVMYDSKIDGLIYFRHQYCFALAGENACTGYDIGNAFSQASKGTLLGNQIGMVPDGTLGYNFKIDAGKTVSLPIYLTAGSTLHEARHQMTQAKRNAVEDYLQITQSYWHQYLKETKPLVTNHSKVKQIYERSLLVFKLMTDKKTGAVIAAPEFDEAYTRCGGYAYCWGRDAAYITTAFDCAGLHQLSRDFYRWTIKAQDPDGSWQQRHYHDGRLAPSWGLQIDEGASILWGMYQHYLATQDLAFLKEVWPTVQKGVTFLLHYLDSETGLPLPSNDLWEERKGEHTYSAAAVYGGIKGAAAIAKTLGELKIAEEWEKVAAQIKQAIETKTYNKEKNHFYRGVKLYVDQEKVRQAENEGKIAFTETDEKGYTRYFLLYDETIDISLLGLTIPFEVLEAIDPRMMATADAIEKKCTSPIIGGILRYENDSYIGGNPWIIATLWLAQFRIKQGRYEEAKKHFFWAVNHATHLDLLPEQIDKQTGETAWVVPLTWSHAMFVLTAHMLAEVGEI
ncbi:glycoside hydrolase family 15 protein [Thermoflavimicrobium dichotomicum]|uniref:Oligosaccharide amylase n=1 Tax=Thermoflavimicrobium dichotomicum TaxID=46223 RepID=A0A1I3P0A7_9BACL|nr:glycoside hydrolase family 15 protein [Thermoflavimicrobium dichotomicum]SFJ14772.1 oligosaccharide amylase [Thermoflavimicrobium dichotomicum]